MGSHVSCNCFQCRHTDSGTKGQHKREAKRSMRRAVKLALRKGEETPKSISSGHKS